MMDDKKKDKQVKKPDEISREITIPSELSDDDLEEVAGGSTGGVVCGICRGLGNSCEAR
jgi:hypothetical protein